MPTKSNAKMVESLPSEIEIAGKTYTLLNANESLRTLPKGASCGTQVRGLPKGKDCSKLMRARRPTPR